MKVRLTLGAAIALALVGGTAEADGEKIALFTKNLTNPHWQNVRQGAEDAAKQMKASILQYVPTKPDSIPEQMSQIEDVVVKKPDAILFIPVDYKAMGPGIRRINDARIPVVNVGDRAEAGDFVAFVGASDYQLGRDVAKAALKATGGKGNFVIIEGVRGTITNSDRTRGFQDALKETPDAKVLASQPANYQRLAALQVMENLMQTYPKIDGVLAANDSMATGVLEALQGAGRRAYVAGVNGTQEAIDLVKSGEMGATGDYAGFLQGCIGAMTAIRHLRGQPVPKDVVFPGVIVTRENAASFEAATKIRTCPKWEDVVKS